MEWYYYAIILIVCSLVDIGLSWHWVKKTGNPRFERNFLPRFLIKEFGVNYGFLTGFIINCVIFISFCYFASLSKATYSNIDYLMASFGTAYFIVFILHSAFYNDFKNLENLPIDNIAYDYRNIEMGMWVNDKA